MCILSNFAALAAALLWKNFQAYSLVIHQAENSFYSLADWFDLSNFITVLLVQTKKVFPTGFYAVIRYRVIWLPMPFFLSFNLLDKRVNFLQSDLTPLYSVFLSSKVLQCFASIHMCWFREETHRQRSWSHPQVLHHGENSQVSEMKRYWRLGHFVIRCCIATSSVIGK